jgi:hypothetical protein
MLLNRNGLRATCDAGLRLLVHPAPQRGLPRLRLMQYRDSSSIRIATFPKDGAAVTFPLRFATCIASALSTLALVAAILPNLKSPSTEALAQSTTPASTQAQDPSNDALRAQLTALRDSFVDSINAAGFKPSLDPPQIVLDNPPSFGRYDSDSNLIHIAAWSELGPDGEGRFARLKSILKDPRSPEEIFDDSVNHWIFIHELSHWWQACQHKDDSGHYAREYGANRIAAAYWRMKDPAYMQRRVEHFRAIYNLFPNPIPPDQSKPKYFDENYERLPGSPAYTWFQSGMVVDVSAENPLPTFKQAL